MTQIERKVTLLAHTQLNPNFYATFPDEIDALYDSKRIDDGECVALTAIRTCYSPGKPSEIVAKEGARYFGKKATDGGKGTDADRLIRMIQSSGHTSTLEGITFNFAVEGVSRALLAQLTRHRVGFSFSVQSQRYVKFGSNDRSGGFDYVMPDKIVGNEKAERYFHDAMNDLQHYYDILREAGVPAEDCRAVLPNAAACNLVLTVNLRALLDFYAKRKAGRGAQSEIAGLAEDLRKAVEATEPWTSQLFEAV
ncbi:putative thymidylate synthase [uncultured Caudovirales phage]|uniref:Putative thymidylate synthase n=1 Tax=uncultured Caudovirales phage TaxID=2100421 RepID=A0A2H4J6H5_9CAUD|nr:putative thymidylate synthase [uncultured Caudovirales phage]